jgi:hypothetical protein
MNPIEKRGRNKMAKTIWKVNDLEYFQAPGLSAVVFHDAYPEGKQGGFEIIQHGERVATNGDVRLEPTPGQWAALPEVGPREADAGKGLVKVPLSYPKHHLDYTMRVQANGDSLRRCVGVSRGPRDFGHGGIAHHHGGCAVSSAPN